MDEQRNIRTFESDVAALKKGAATDLAPTESTSRQQTTDIVPDATLTGRVPLFPAEAESEGGLREPTLTPTPIPPPVAVPGVPQRPIVAPSEEGKLAVASGERGPLKTYADDFRAQMKETQASTATVLAAEQDSARFATEASPQKTLRSNLIYGIAGGMLLISGMVGAYVAYTRYLGASSPVVVAPTVTAPIFVDEREQISGTGAALIQAIEKSVARPISQGAIRLLYLTSTSSEQATPSAGVFSSLQVSAPGALMRNTDATQSMAGVIQVNGKQSPFFILSVTYYGETFAAMLQWEPLMLRDLSKLFPPYAVSSREQTSLTTTATSTVATSTQKGSIKIATTTTTTVTTKPAAPVSVATFHDITVANHDARVYRDTAGHDVLIYGYWNQATLVIARDTAAFTEILGRLATSHAQ